MPKLPVIKSKEIIKILKKAGFEIHHTTGSHYVLKHPVSKKIAIVPYHLKDLPPGTTHSILKMAGIKREEIKSGQQS